MSEESNIEMVQGNEGQEAYFNMVLANKRMGIYLEEGFPTTAIYDNDPSIRVMGYSRNGWTITALHDINEMVVGACIRAIHSNLSGLDADVFIDPIRIAEWLTSNGDSETADELLAISSLPEADLSDEDRLIVHGIVRKATSDMTGISADSLQDITWYVDFMDGLEDGLFINDFVEVTATPVDADAAANDTDTTE